MAKYNFLYSVVKIPWSYSIEVGDFISIVATFTTWEKANKYMGDLMALEKEHNIKDKYSLRTLKVTE